MNKASVGVCKVYFGEVNIDKASVDSQEQLANRATSDILSASTSGCNISHSENAHSLDSLKALCTSEDPQMPHNVGISDTAVKDQDQNVLFSQDKSSFCVSKDDVTILMSSDHTDDASHKNIKSSAAPISVFCADSLEICRNGQADGSGPLVEQFSVEGNSGQAVLETVGFSDRVDPSETSAYRDELSGGPLSKGAPSECSVDQADSSSVKMPHSHNTDRKFNEESCVTGKAETESNDDTLNSSIPITNAQEPPVQGHTVPDNNGSDELMDVRVCDICGDVGREALLALCSKCSDGAEHIYCMRIKMDQVPEHDWVCEDCMLMQEPKRLKLTEVERSKGTCNPSYLKGTTQGLPTSHSSGWNVDGLKTNHSSKRSCLSAKRPVPDAELKSAPKRRALQKGIQLLASSHFGGKTLLTRASSLNITGKSKDRGPQVSSLGNQSTVEVVESTSPLPGHKSPKPGSGTEIRLAPKNINREKSCQPPKSPGFGGKSMLTRVSSSKVMNKGKGACHQASSFGIQSAKKEMEQEISLSGHRSPKPNQQLHPLNSASVPGGKSQSTWVSSSKIMDKGEGAHFHASSLDVQSAKKDKEQERSPSGLTLPKPELQFQALKPSSISARKSQFALSSLKIMDKGKEAPCLESAFGIWSAKKDVKQASPLPGHRQPECKPECLAGSLSKSKPINIADSDVEVRRIHKDICSGSRTVTESANHELKNCHRKKLSKSMSFSGSSSVSAQGSNDPLAYASNVENLRHGSKGNSAEKRSAQLGLPVVDFDAMEGKPSQAKMVSEIIGRPHSSSNDVTHMTSIQVNGNSDLKVLGSCACDDRSYENTLTGESAQKADLTCSSREDDSQVVTSNNVLPVDPRDTENSLALTPADVASSGMSAVPESECIWKGAFQLEEGGKLPNYCHRIQAHLSTCASSKALELVPKFHPELMLKEVPRLDIWPVQFQRNCTTERDIALYFFAEDLLSHAGSYTVLLEGMIRDDLALEANFDGVQLLVFPSSLLSVGSKRWNDLFFLWGIFRVRKADNHSICISSMNAATLNQGLCTRVTCGALNRALCASEAGSLSTSHTSDNSIKGLESVNTKAWQSSSSTKFMNQSCEHDEVSSAEKSLGTLRTEDLVSCKDNGIAFATDYVEKSFSDSMLHSNNFEKEDDPLGYSNTETHIFPFGGPGKDSIVSVSDFLQEEKRLDVSRSSFSIDSGPSGSSDGAGFAKSDEGQVDQFQDHSSCKTLNLDLCLRPMSEPAIDVDLVLGSPNTKKYKVEHFSNDRKSEHRNVSLFLSLGLPCSNGRTFPDR